MSLFHPKMKYKALTDIKAHDLLDRGIRLLILDVDNTVSPYRVDTVTEKTVMWAEYMKGSGITLFILSNNRGGRPAVFAAQLGVEYIKRAGKPSPKGVDAVLEKTGFSRGETAIVGDQVYTDMLCANRAGITGILVEPIKFTYPWLALRYFAELPFRGTK